MILQYSSIRICLNLIEYENDDINEKNTEILSLEHLIDDRACIRMRLEIFRKDS